MNIVSCVSRGTTFWAFSKNHDAPPLKLLNGHQLTLGRPLEPPKNQHRQFGINPKMSNFEPILAYTQKKAHLAIIKPPAGTMIGPNFWYWA